MIAEASSNGRPERLRDRLAGQHLLITGSTGFLAKAFVEKLLRCVDTLDGITLLVRGRGEGQTPENRVRRSVLGTHAFDRLRASMGEGFTRLCEEKINVVGGDLTKDKLGLDPAVYDQLKGRITLVVNSAATVTFDEQLDLAISLNTQGPGRLLQFAKDCGNIPMLHVSTCYVCGARRGTILEDLSAPESAREKLPRLPDGSFDFDGLIASMMKEAAGVRKEMSGDNEACRRRLIDLGMSHARSYGWNDTYTFTKWIGEQLLVRDRGDVRVVIHRPAIIESSFDEPLPGWIDGLRMADPIIVAYGRGKLDDFPARSDVPLDLIPVDFVVNTMIATLPVGSSCGEEVSVYQCGSSERHPLMLGELGLSLERAFLKRPMTGDDGRPIKIGRLNIVEQSTFVRRWEKKRRRVAGLQRLLGGLGMKGRRLRRLSSMARQIEQVIYFAKIYSPYTHLDCHFSDEALRGVMDKLHPEDQEIFRYKVERIDWDDYLVNRHVPGLRSFVLGAGGEPSPRILAAEAREHVDHGAGEDALQGENLFEVFRQSAVRFADKPAVQIRRNGRWVRYTYGEMLLASGAIMRRFQERGLVPGDRVALVSESSPEWGLVYLAMMRAGLTAVPLDPQWPPDEIWSAARFANAKLLCASKRTFDPIAKRRGSEDVEVVAMQAPFIPPSGASRDAVPAPASVDGYAVASILFTSGTTVAPKAVPLTHRNFIANAQALLQVHSLNATDELLSVMPMYHAFEFAGGFLVPLACGATITYVEQIKGPDIMAAMQATGTSIMLVVPRLLRAFLDSIENKVAAAGTIKRTGFRLLGTMSDVTGHRYGRRLFGAVHKQFGGRLRMFVVGGSRLDPEDLATFERMGFGVYEGYGLTETSPVLTLNPPRAARGGSVGPPLPNVELELRNQNLEGIGEVWVKGPSVMVGYLDDPEATAEVIEDGWFRTGDLGLFDEEGYLVLTGRSKDLIVTGAGKNVYPDEVEVRYRDLPHVRDLCVFGMPSTSGTGDTVHAVVVLDTDAHPDLDPSSLVREIRLSAATISQFLPSHQRITAFHFWTRDLPKTSTLKAKRGMIRDIVQSEDITPTIGGGASVSVDDLSVSDEAAQLEQTPTFAVLRRILATHCKRGEETIRASMHLLLDLEIDSIGKLDLLGEVEATYGMQIDDEAGSSIARVADLVRAVGDRTPLKKTHRDQSGWQRRLARSNGSETTVDDKLAAPLVPVRWLVRGGGVALMHTYWRIHVEGRENIPSTGPFILAPNHSSHLDTPSVITAIGGKRRVWSAGAQDYFFNTAIKRFLFGKVFDIIAFDRRSDGLQGLRRCGEALRRGDGLLIYPEGTRSTTGTLQPFKIGAAVLAVEAQVPIVPVLIERSYELFRKGRRFPRPGTITVRFGKPILPPVVDDTTEHYAAFRSLIAQVQEAVAALSGKVAT